jgi:hypothetical protein
MKLKMRILFLLILLINSNFVFAQTMDLVCTGEETFRGSDGTTILKKETQTYSFKNGKYGGIVNATWSDTVISIKGPTEKEDPGCRIFCNRNITINRISGEVNDIHSSNMGNVKGYFWFKGNCTASKKKF